MNNVPVYIDKYGDEWYRIGYLVLRKRDRNVGGWFNGQGLTLKRGR